MYAVVPTWTVTLANPLTFPNRKLSSSSESKDCSAEDEEYKDVSLELRTEMIIVVFDIL